MSTINRLSSVDVLQPSDQIPVWDSSNGDTRKASMSTLLAFVESYFADPDYSTRIVAPNADYFNVDIGSTGDSLWMIVNPALDFSNGTLTLPPASSAVNDQEITVVFTKSVLTLVIASSGAAILGAPTQVAGYDSFRVRYNASQATWYTLDTTGTGAGGGVSQIVRQDFTGDGATTTFVLDSLPLGLGNQLQIFIDGVYQERASYTVTGLNLIFGEAPPSLSTIEVLGWTVSLGASTTANLVAYSRDGSSTVTNVAEELDRTTTANMVAYELGTTAAVSLHPGIATGYIIRTNYFDSAKTSGSGAEHRFTGTTTAGKAGNWPDADGYFYDADGKQFEVVGSTVSVLWFGAVGNGTANDTDAIQTAIDAVGTKGVITGAAGSIFAVTGRLNLSDKTLKDIEIVYTSNTATIVVGGAGKLQNVNITLGTTYSTSNGGPLCGVVNLHLADGAVLDGVVIPDAGLNTTGQSRIAVFCSTLASNVVIKNCVFDYVGYGILYSDDTPANRIVDTIDYSAFSIGSDLFVDNCSFGASDKVLTGDGVEINCPLHRFSNLRVSNCRSLKSAALGGDGGTGGIGIGASTCDGVMFVNNYIVTSRGSGGALHVEFCTNTVISNNVVSNSWKGIGCGSDGVETLINGNAISGCEQSIQVVGGVAVYSSITISNNIISSAIAQPLVIINAVGVSIFNNTFIGMLDAAKNIITLIQSGGLTCSNVIISGNTISNPLSTTLASILGISGTVTEVLSQNNQFYSISKTLVSVYTDTVRNVGLTQDHFTMSSDTVNGKNITCTRAPTGYLSGSLGDFATDVNGGVIYRHDGAAWVSKVS